MKERLSRNQAKPTGKSWDLLFGRGEAAATND
jgi:hypothetical protein